MNRHFSKDDTQMVNKPMKRCSTSLVIREIQLKTIIRYHFVDIRIAIIKTTENSKYWQRCREIRTLVHC